MMAKNKSRESIISELRSNINEIETQQGITTSKIKKQNFKSEDEAFKKIQRLINCREHSVKSLTERLERSGFSGQVSNAAVERACECGLVSNARFAEVLVTSRRSQGYGIKGIECELKKNDIDPASCAVFCQLEENQSTEQEIERAVEFLSKHPSHSKNPMPAAYRKLLGRGYESSIASAAARKWAETLQGQSNEQKLLN